MLPLSQQIFRPSRSAAVAGVAIAGDNKTEASVEPVASDNRSFAVISVPLRDGHRRAMLASSRPGLSRLANHRMPLIAPIVQPLLRKYSVFPNTQISLYFTRPVPQRGRLAIVTNAGRDAVDAERAKDEGA